VIIMLLAALSGSTWAAAPAPKAKPVALRASGRVLKISTGRLTLADDAGHLEEFAFDVKTKATCDGHKFPLMKVATPGVCDRASKLLYDPTKRISVLELKSAVKADVDDAKGRPNASGEVAATDVLAGQLSVRLGGGAMLNFKIVPATKIFFEAEGAAPAEKPFEAVKIGDRVEVRSKDWKTADDIHFRGAER
jgi:hypothetical protein